MPLIRFDLSDLEPTERKSIVAITIELADGRKWHVPTPGNVGLDADVGEIIFDLDGVEVELLSSDALDMEFKPKLRINYNPPS